MFSRILYYLLLLPLSRLPFSILYRFSDLLFFLVSKVFTYRKKVVEENLANAFPELPGSQLREIRDSFYAHFCDLAVETIKTLSIGKDELSKRVRVRNPEVLWNNAYKDRNMILLTAHYGNWEWAALQLASHLPGKEVYGIYLPLNNRFFDNIIRKSRKKFGTRLISTKDLPKVLGSETGQKPSAFAFIADQNPSNLNKTGWVNFFGREVPVAKGPERYANKLDAVVFYGHIEKAGRGYYEITYELLTEKPRSLTEGLLLSEFMEKAETHIKENPAFWLWSHKRWKHKKKASL